MEIINIELCDRNRRSVNRSVLKCVSIGQKEVGTLFKLAIDEKDFYFKVDKITCISSNELVNFNYLLSETGYYNLLSERAKKINLRNLIGCELEQIDDEKEIKKLQQESCYC